MIGCKDHNPDPVTIPPVTNPQFEVNAWRAGGTGKDEGNYITVDGSGNVYVLGQFFNSVTFGTTTLTSNGDRDVFVVKYNNNGEVQWAKSAGGTGSDSGLSIAVDGSSNVYVTGFYYHSINFGATALASAGLSDMYVAKFKSNGEVQWAKSAGGTGYDNGSALAVDGGGNVYVGGSFTGSVSFGMTTLTCTGESDIYVAKYSSSGDLQWAKREGGVGSETVRGVAVDNSGNIYTTGTYIGTTTFGSTTLTPINPIGVVVDIYVTKFSNNGEVQWAKSAGSRGNETTLDIAVDGSGNAYITGYTTGLATTFGSITLNPIGDYDTFIAKYSTNGEVQWAKIAGGTGADQGQGIAVDESGNLYVTGNFSGTFTFGTTTLTSNGDLDIYVAKYNNAGDVQWVKSAGGSGTDRGQDIVVDGSSKAYVTGLFSDTATFGSTTLTSSGDKDMFVAKFKN